MTVESKDDHRDELDELLLAKTLGPLSDSQRIRLEELVGEDTEARRRYLAYARVEAQLRWRYSKVGVELMPSPPEPRPPRPAARRLRWVVAAAACVAVLVLAWMWLPKGPGAARIPLPPEIAETPEVGPADVKAPEIPPAVPDTESPAPGTPKREGDDKESLVTAPARGGKDAAQDALATPDRLQRLNREAEWDDLAEGIAAGQTEAVDKIPIDKLPADADPNVVWDHYFARFAPTERAVRDAVRQLMLQEQFAHVIGLIHTSLRDHQAQPWMYEVLTLAMEADGRTPEEIERAVMSAADFADNPADMMHLGAYMARLGLNVRAMQMFRQVAQAEPLWVEPYMHGLKVARNTGDVDGIRWATIGILSQAWTNDHADVWELGLFVANDTLSRLRADQKTEAEAKEFEAALDEAVERDCVVRVSWTGDADIDLLVEEPPGTVCSVQTPRTSGGGVMLGDGFSRDTADTRGYEEVYVCPKGFDGTYRVLVRRVWGNVTAGKVNVEVIKHYRGRKAERFARSVPLKKDEAWLVFDLEGGRRREALEEHQLANAANVQMAVSRQVLSQQLAAAEDPAASAPFGRPGAVGYQPVVITLPEGANLAATAVVSADRRYVRITTVPLFSGIAEVNTFSSATDASSGDEDSGSVGTGGRGFSQIFQNQGTQGNVNPDGDGGNP